MLSIVERNNDCLLSLMVSPGTFSIGIPHTISLPDKSKRASITANGVKPTEICCERVAYNCGSNTASAHSMPFGKTNLQNKSGSNALVRIFSTFFLFGVSRIDHTAHLELVAMTVPNCFKPDLM